MSRNCQTCGKWLTKKQRRFCSRECVGKGNRGSWEEQFGKEKAAKMKQECSDRCSGEGNPMYGRKNPHTEEAKRKIRKTIHAWYDSEEGEAFKQMMSKKSSQRLAKRVGKKVAQEIKERNRKWLRYHRNNDPRFIKASREANKGRELTEEWKKNIGKGGKRFWDGMTDEEKDDYLKKTIWKNRGNRKTHLEEQCETLLQEHEFDFTYNGAGANRSTINGCYPDFVHTKKNIVVEVFAKYWKILTYGSVKEYKKLRKEQLKGYKIIFVNEDQINKEAWLKEVSRAVGRS